MDGEEQNRVTFAVAETRSAMNRKIYNHSNCKRKTPQPSLQQKFKAQTTAIEVLLKTLRKKPLVHHSIRQNKTNKTTQH